MSLSDATPGLAPPTDDNETRWNFTSAAVLQPPQLEPIAAVVAPIIFAVVFLVGVTGNCLQLMTVVCNRQIRRSPPNVLIACLAVADLTLLLISVPFAATVYTLPRWPFGLVVCKLSTSVQLLSVAVSVLTLTAMSGDRYVAIVHPLTALRSSSLRRTLSVVAVIWIVSVAIAVPDFVASEVHIFGQNVACAGDRSAGDVEEEGCDVMNEKTVVLVAYCDAHPESWGELYKLLRATVIMIVLFVVPLVAIAVFYCAVAWTLLCSDATKDPRRMQVELGSIRQYAPTALHAVMPANSMAAMLDRQDKERKRVAKLVLSLVIVFVVCWLPRHVYLMCFYGLDIEFNHFWHAFKIIGFIMTFVYSCVNPLALYLFSDEFRRYFDHYLFGCCCPSKRLRHRRDTQTAITFDTNRKRASASTAASTPNNISLENLAR